MLDDDDDTIDVNEYLSTEERRQYLQTGFDLAGRTIPIIEELTARVQDELAEADIDWQDIRESCSLAVRLFMGIDMFADMMERREQSDILRQSGQSDRSADQHHE